MNTLQLTKRTDTDQLVIEVPEKLRGKELFITIQEKPVAKRVSEEEYRHRMDDLKSVQFKGQVLYEASEDEYYEQ